jgi:hypothetical protein
MNNYEFGKLLGPAFIAYLREIYSDTWKDALVEFLKDNEDFMNGLEYFLNMQLTSTQQQEILDYRCQAYRCTDE